MAADRGSVVASFPTPDHAKAAMVALEWAGVTHRDVHLLYDRPDPGGADLARGDHRVVGWLARRWLRGALIGAVVGAPLIMGAVLLVKDGPLYPAWIGAALGGAVAGAFLGGFMSVGLGMPRNPRAWETYRLAHDDEACVVVRLRSAIAEPRVTEVLSKAGATSVERLGTSRRRIRR